MLSCWYVMTSSDPIELSCVSTVLKRLPERLFLNAELESDIENLAIFYLIQSSYLVHTPWVWWLKEFRGVEQFAIQVIRWIFQDHTPIWPEQREQPTSRTCCCIGKGVRRATNHSSYVHIGILQDLRSYHLPYCTHWQVIEHWCTSWARCFLPCVHSCR